jgi:hypothetical protein
MVMKMPPVMIPLSSRVPGRAPEPSRSRVCDGGGYRNFHGIMIGPRGFSRGREYIVGGERTQMSPRGGGE